MYDQISQLPLREHMLDQIINENYSACKFTSPTSNNSLGEEIQMSKNILCVTAIKHKILRITLKNIGGAEGTYLAH